jgi:hypothetical protein
MAKLSKIILISLIAVFGAGFLFVSPAYAQPADPLIVEYWTGSAWLPLSGPIFSETNFLPGDGITRLIRVTNNSGESQRIATEAINENDPDNLASQLNLTVKEGISVIFDDTLAQFFSQGETYLSNLANGAQTQYDFTITFNSGSGNEYQGKALGFDILLGFEGTVGGLQLPSPGGSFGGAWLPPGLTILNETEVSVTEESVTITWDTNYPATSQVVYAVGGELYTFDLSQPNYGYPHATPEDTNKVTYHSVTITGLTSGTTYYYRCVSHGSFAVSTEHSFATLVRMSEEEIEEEIISGEEGNAGTQGGENIGGSEILETEEESLVTETGGRKEIVFGSEKDNSEEEKGPNRLLAAIGNFFNFGNFWWLVFLIILILIIIFFLSRKKKKEE